MTETLVDSLIQMFPEVPFQKLLGIEIVEVATDRAVVCLPYRGDLAGGGNAFHGGAISSLLDLTGALAAWSGHDPKNGMKAATVSGPSLRMSCSNWPARRLANSSSLSPGRAKR